MDRKSGFRSVRSFAIVIGRAYFEAKKRRKYTKNVVVIRSGNTTVFIRKLVNTLVGSKLLFTCIGYGNSTSFIAI